jgi:hypothetical protein
MKSVDWFRVCAALSIGLVVAGCNSKSDPTNDNFSKAIQNHFDKTDAVCVRSGAVPFELPHFGSYQEKQADALVAVGLLSKDSVSVSESGRSIPGYRYSATSEGKTAYRAAADPADSSMCGGKAQVQSITWSSSVPDKAPIGTTVDVKYSAKLIERPRWDDESVLRSTHVEVLSTSSDVYSGEYFLELTDSGWAVKSTPMLR